MSQIQSLLQETLFPSGGGTGTFPPSLKSMNLLDSMFLGVSHHQLERITGDASGIHEVVVITLLNLPLSLIFPFFLFFPFPLSCSYH